MGKPSTAAPAEQNGENGAPRQPPNKIPGSVSLASRSSSSRQNEAPASLANASTDAQQSKQSSAASSVTPSPLGSRDSSPSRNPRRTASSSRLSTSRSRKNSQQDLSPTRIGKPGNAGPTSAPRSLSSTPTPKLPAPDEPQIHAPTPQKPTVVPDLKETPKWPVSPRLRSPPPQLNKPATSTSRKADQDQQSPSAQRSTPSTLSQDLTQSLSENDFDDDSQLGMRTPARAALETVQEVSLPNSPSPSKGPGPLEQVKDKTENKSEPALNDGQLLRARQSTITGESGSESSGNKAETRRTTSVPPPLVSRQSSALSAKQPKSKQEGSTQNMTVETETVSSIPSVALSAGNKSEGPNGSLKAKPSTETIKPKKDKKKTVRKQPAVNTNTSSSKADIFEAKIASAVDEANTSDSEETFVYDSNPADGGDRGARRFHSRTPSATSMASQADRQNLRSIYGVMEGGSTTSGPKRSMKFVNTFNGTGGDSLAPANDDDGKGTIRSAGGSGRGTARHHHHIGRWGRQPGNGHPSLFDNESPFPNARSKLNGSQSRNSSNPPSPRNHHSARGHLNTKRSAIQMSSSYDADDTTGADDERTPLMGSIRSPRSARGRRGPHSLRQAEAQTYTRRPSYLNRFAACLVLTIMFILVITGAIGFMFATSQPLTGIDITSINNVVTSEQVLMFDLTVKAHNPNIVVVTIDQANLEIFAKSEHAGTDSDWWKKPDGQDIHTTDDPANDPPNDEDDSKPNVLLGRITEFDSPLTFEGSLFHKGTSASRGELQLANPGNGTSGGIERWERIFQNEFDLIVKGVVKYSLPLSARVRSATVSGRTTVKPNSANDPNDPSLKPNSTEPVGF